MAIKKATPAAKKELHAVEKRLDSKIDSVKEELHAVEKRLDQKIDSVENRLTQKIEKVAIEITQTNVRMDRMENNIMTGLREFRSELLNAFEQSVVKGKMYEDKAVTHGQILIGHEDKLADHESRLAVLEKK